MRKTFAVLVIFFLLSGCSSKLSFSEVTVIANEDIQSFIENVIDENGVHLYFENEKALYIYLNGYNINQSELATHFTDFDVEENDKTLNILYKSAETADYSNHSLKHGRLFKVHIDKKYDNLKLIRNGEEVPFGVISGK